MLKIQYSNNYKFITLKCIIYLDVFLGSYLELLVKPLELFLVYNLPKYIL